MPANSFISSSEFRFLKKGLLLLLVLAAADWGLGRILHRLYFSAQSGEQFETTFAFKKSNAEVLITGSSKARRNYNTRLISDSLGVNCYNAGRDGQSVFYSYALTKVILNRHLPKLVVVELFPEEMYFNNIHYDRLNVLLPYYDDFKEVREVVLWRGLRENENETSLDKIFSFNTEKIKMLSQTYRYNSMWLELLKGRMVSEKTTDGFAPLLKTITQQDKEKYIAEFELMKQRQPGRHIDNNKMAALRELLQLCISKNVKVVVAMSPVLKRYSNDPVYEKLNALCNSLHVPLLDYTGHSDFENIQYFADNHLNSTGANHFSRLIASELKTLMSK